MTKADLITQMSKTTCFDEQIVLQIVESFMQTVKETLGKKENIYLRGFGCYKITHSAEKVAHNSHDQLTVKVPIRNIPAFKPSKELEDRVKWIRSY